MSDHITMADYWMGRDKAYPDQCTDEIRANAEVIVERANRLLDAAAVDGVVSTKSDSGFGHVNSGWRPAAVNATIPNAARSSKHMLAQAIDIDDDGGELDEWCLTDTGQDALIRLGLYLEHPAATKGWCHVQSVPPKSGNRTFYP